MYNAFTCLIEAQQGSKTFGKGSVFSLSGGQSAHSGSVTQLQHRIECTPDQNSFPCIEAVFCHVSDALRERDPKKKINKAA